MSDYKEYSLKNLEEWLHDAISCAEASPQEIYDTIKKVVEETYYTYKHKTWQAYELLALINDKKLDISKIEAPIDKMESEGFEMSADGFWVPTEKPKVNKWVLPVEVDDVSGDYYIQLPDDMLEQLNWNEGDMLSYIDNEDGSFTIKKENKSGTI